MTSSVLTAAATPSDNAAQISALIATLSDLTKERTETALKALADLEKIKKPLGRRFILAWARSGEDAGLHLVRGLEFPGESCGSEAASSDRIIIDDRGAPFYSRHFSMQQFIEELNQFKLIYHIEYID